MKSPADLIFVANRLPWPLDDGWKRRTFAMLSAASVVSQVRLLVRDDYSEEYKGQLEQALSGRCAVHAYRRPRRRLLQLAAGMIGDRKSPLAALHAPRSLRDMLQTLVDDSRPAAIIYTGAYMAVWHFVDADLRKLPSFIDTHNIDSQAISRSSGPHAPLTKRVLATIAAQLIRREESTTFCHASAVFVCSQTEMAQVRVLAPHAHVQVIPNGIDTSFFFPQAAKPSKPPFQLLFFGRLDYAPNIDAVRYFAESIEPHLRSDGFDYNLRVVGAGDSTEAAQILKNVPSATLVGQVDDLRDELRNADIIIVPLRDGGGTRLKILEALASARPVVSTSIGAEGIDVRDDEHLLIRDGAEAFAKGVTELCTDSSRAVSMSARAAALMRANYDWSTITQQAITLFARAGQQ